MELLIYLLKVSACTVLFFAFYLLVLRHLTFFKFNRFYLLTTLLLCFIIPTLNFTIEREVEVTPAVYTQSEVGNEVIVNEAISATGSIETTPFIEESFNYYSLLPYLYFAIVSSLLIIATRRILKLFKYTKGIKHELNGLKIVQKSAGFTNCSFFNYVFIDEKLSEAELQVLLKHEEVHAKQLHSIDKILMMLIKAFLWFNPVVYLYDKALEQAHEYEADEATSQNFGTEKYANLLLRLAIAKSEMPLVHNFVKSPIKDRIKMLFNSKSKNMKKLMYLLALPIGLGLLWGFTVKVVEVSKAATEGDEKTFTLVLDAGHGGNEKGAVVNGISEKDITLAMAKKIKKLAEAKGIKVVTTREVDENVSIKDRVKANGDILISLHVISEPIAKGGKRNGIEMYTAVMDGALKVSKANSLSHYLFKGIQHIKGISIKDERTPKNLLLLRESNLAAVILELGYLTNKNDLKFITDEAKQNELATGIIDGILLYKEKTPSDEELERSQLSYFKDKLTKPQTSFIEVEKMTFAGGRPGFYVFVKSTNGKKMQTIGTEGMVVKFFIEGRLYSLDEAKAFNRDFIDKLSVNQGGGRGYYYNVRGVANEEYVFWFGNEPPIQASVALSKSASSRYTGKSVYGKVLGYSYNSKNNEMDGFILQQKNDEKLKIFIDPKFAKLITKQLQISDEIKVKAFNAYFVNGAKFPEIGSSTISKNGKVIFDRAKVVIDARPEGLKTDYSTLSKIEYLSSDSVTFSNDRKIVDLYGKASLNLDSIQLNANHININNNTKIITAKDAEITSKFNNVNVIAPIIYYNLKTKSYNVKQLKGTYK